MSLTCRCVDNIDLLYINDMHVANEARSYMIVYSLLHAVVSVGYSTYACQVIKSGKYQCLHMICINNKCTVL